MTKRGAAPAVAKSIVRRLMQPDFVCSLIISSPDYSPLRFSSTHPWLADARGPPEAGEDRYSFISAALLPRSTD
jgi:hypothetical protein